MMSWASAAALLPYCKTPLSRPSSSTGSSQRWFWSKNRITAARIAGGKGEY